MEDVSVAADCMMQLLFSEPRKQNISVGGRWFFSLSRGEKWGAVWIRIGVENDLSSHCLCHLSVDCTFPCPLATAHDRKNLHYYIVVNGRGSFLFMWLQYKPISNIMICELTLTIFKFFFCFLPTPENLPGSYLAFTFYHTVWIFLRIILEGNGKLMLFVPMKSILPVQEIY